MVRLRLFHSTDASLRPGDEVVPAAARNHRSRHVRAPGYDPTLVYLYDEGTGQFDADNYGSRTYEVEVEGEVERDPEALEWAARAGKPVEDTTMAHVWATRGRVRVVREWPHHGGEW